MKTALIITLALLALTGCKTPQEQPGIPQKRETRHVHKWSEWSEVKYSESFWAGRTATQTRHCQYCGTAEVKKLRIKRH